MRGIDLEQADHGLLADLRIVATPPIGYGIIPQALKRFLAKRPGGNVR